jgi:predicted nicotinamide N-methyase
VERRPPPQGRAVRTARDDAARPVAELTGIDLVDDSVQVGPYVVALKRPREAEALIDEARFDQGEFMPYWAELWPAGVALAETVAEIQPYEARVVELGCGLALPSIVAALAGAEALATDWAPEALALARRNGTLNGVDIQTLEVDWAEPGVLVERAPFDLVLCSDVLYEPRNVESLLALLPQLGPEVLLGEPGRQTAGDFFLRAEQDWEITRAGRVSRLRRR